MLFKIESIQKFYLHTLFGKIQHDIPPYLRLISGDIYLDFYFERTTLYHFEVRQYLSV